MVIAIQFIKLEYKWNLIFFQVTRTSGLICLDGYGNSLTCSSSYCYVWLYIINTFYLTLYNPFFFFDSLPIDTVTRSLLALDVIPIVNKKKFQKIINTSNNSYLYKKDYCSSNGNLLIGRRASLCCNCDRCNSLYGESNCKVNPAGKAAYCISSALGKIPIYYQFNGYAFCYVYYHFSLD